VTSNDRIQTLETEIRSLRVAVWISPLLICLLAIYWQISQDDAETAVGPASFETVTARSFVLVDSTGTERGSFEVWNDATLLTLHDGSLPRIRLWASEEYAGISLLNQFQEPSLVAFDAEGTVGLQLFDEFARERWRLSSNADGHSQLEFSDEDGEKILELGVEGSDNPFARMLLTCPHLCIHIQS
jgi:hypothetical protein